MLRNRNSEYNIQRSTQEVEKGGKFAKRQETVKGDKSKKEVAKRPTTLAFCDKENVNSLQNEKVGGKKHVQQDKDFAIKIYQKYR